MNGCRSGTRSTCRAPNQRTASAAGSEVGSIDRLPDDDSESDRLGLEHRAREEPAQRRLQQVVVERAGGERGGNGHARALSYCDGPSRGRIVAGAPRRLRLPVVRAASRQSHGVHGSP